MQKDYINKENYFENDLKKIELFFNSDSNKIIEVYNKIIFETENTIKVLNENDEKRIPEIIHKYLSPFAFFNCKIILNEFSNLEDNFNKDNLSYIPIFHKIKEEINARLEILLME